MVRSMTEDVVPTREFGDYDIFEQLGHGGIGETFVARLKRDTAAGLLDRYVCLKMMGREFQSARGDRRRQAIESLRHEARIVAGLNHPNIARLLDSGAYNDVWFLAFELVSGANLDEILATRRPGEGLEPEHVRRIGIQVAAALECAHEHRVLHRDVKPGNILIGTDGRVKLVDFGLAKANAGASADFTVGVGTPRYWAPEQILQETLTEATDLYALGVVLYELLTTTHPSHADTPEDFRRNIVRGKRRPLVDFGVPEDLATIIECCLETSPENRFLSARALHTALRSGTKVSGFEFEIGQMADAARDAVAEQRSFEPDEEWKSGDLSTVHASQEGPTQHMPALAVACAVRDGVPGEMAQRPRDEILSDLSRMARDALRQRESHTQRRRRSTTVAEIELPLRSQRPPEPPTAAASVRARKREGTLAEVPFLPPVSTEKEPQSLETRPEFAAPGATAEPPVPRARQDTQLAQRARPARVHYVAAATFLVLISLAFVKLQLLQSVSSESSRASVAAGKPLVVPLPAAIEPPAATQSSPAAVTVPATEPAPDGSAVAHESEHAGSPTVDQSAPRHSPESASHDNAKAGGIHVTIGLIPYGKVVVDGRRSGPAPFKITLSPGKHRIVGRSPGGRSRAKTIDVSADSTSFVMDLRDDHNPSP